MTSGSEFKSFSPTFVAIYVETNLVQDGTGKVSLVALDCS
jgi:hypothetical protein